MNRWEGKVAVVTGASSGIGLGTVEHLVNSGLKVVGLARRKERMEELAKKLEEKSGKFYSVQTDVSIESEILRAFDWITHNVGPIHILINSAGIVRPNGLLNGQTGHWKEILDTNVLALCVATREAIKIMRANNIDGHIIHINSISGHIVSHYPNSNIYPAAKHAVTALTETLRQELNSIGSKIKITSVSPGYLKTELLQASGMVFTQAMQDAIKNAPVLEVEDVVDAVFYVLGTPPHVQIHEIIMTPVGEKH